VSGKEEPYPFDRPGVKSRWKFGRKGVLKHPGKIFFGCGRLRKNPIQREIEIHPVRFLNHESIPGGWIRRLIPAFRKKKRP
jgi:hypothetical protein